MRFSGLVLGLVLSVAVVCRGDDDIYFSNQDVMPGLDDYVKRLVEKEVHSMMAQWRNSQKSQDAKIRALQSDLHQERLLRKELEARMDILEEQWKTTFEISAVRQSNVTTETINSAAASKRLNRTDPLTSTSNATSNRNGEGSKFRRLLIGQEPTPHNTVAFYAYMSHDLAAPSGGHVLVFDVVKTNVGSAYNHHDGIFTAPSTGSYVFSWTVTSWYHSYVYSELMVNSSAFGKLLTNSADISDEHVGSTVVAAALTQGDVVYVRVAASSGTLASHSNVYTSFTGWKLF